MPAAIGIILFARMSAGRLPGKPLARLGPTSLFDRVVARARHLHRPIILATSTDSSDDVLCQASESIGVPVFRGSLHDVLDRACEAARAAGFEAFARLCGDRPFLPLEDMRRGIAIMSDHLSAGRPLDLVTSGYPRPVPPGLLTEVINSSSLERIREESRNPHEREHVTPAFHARPQSYVVHELFSPLQDLVDVHLSVDTETDRILLGKVIDACPDITVSEVRAAEIFRAVRMQWNEESKPAASTPPARKTF